MKSTQLFIPSLREAPADAEAEGLKLMIRSGLIRKLASGVYSYLPMGLRVMRRIESLLREELNRCGAQEAMCPVMIPLELLEGSGNIDEFKDEILSAKDRTGREFCIGTEYDEEFCELVKNDIRTYKNLPLRLYQFSPEFRDERRPRLGFIRAREFEAMDLYSFDRNEEGCRKSFDDIHNKVLCFLQKCGIEYSAVRNDFSEENEASSLDFIVESEYGEYEAVYCGKCGYEYSRKASKALPKENTYREELKPMEKIETPEVRTIEELTDFLHTTPSKFAKTLIYKSGEKTIAVMVRGDREVNEAKVKNFLGLSLLEMADAETVMRVTTAEVGFAGPVGIKTDLLLVDNEVKSISNMVVGANDTGYHYANVNYERDFKGSLGDFRMTIEGDTCPVCGEALRIKNAIKVGSIAKTGTKFTGASGVKFIDEDGGEKTPLMISCKIGISRIMAVIAEKNRDEKGIIWPENIAPFDVIIVPVAVKDEVQVKVADELHDRFTEAGLQVLVDDRDERAGVKFNDADLLGIPVRITVGKKIKDGLVEFKLRHEQSAREIGIEDVLEEAVKVYR